VELSGLSLPSALVIAPYNDETTRRSATVDLSANTDSPGEDGGSSAALPPTRASFTVAGRPPGLEENSVYVAKLD
jgi:hypothetical protein